MKLDTDQWRVQVIDSASSADEIFWPATSIQASHPAEVRGYAQQRQRQHVLAAGAEASPVSLQELTLEAFLQQLKSLCQERNYADNKRALKHYLKFLLPAPLRQQLLNLALKDRRIYTLVDLNIFELLLSPMVQQVEVQSIRPFFRQPFTAMLRQLGNGLQHLVLEDNSWLQGRDSLSPAFARMSGLRYVSLRYLANDMMIAALAKNCHLLQEMDVSNSVDVTDTGMKVLCDPDSVLVTEFVNNNNNSNYQCDNKASNENVKRFRKISAPVGVRPGCLVWLPRLMRGIRRHSVTQSSSFGRRPSQSSAYRINEEADSAALLWPEDEIAVAAESCETRCIRSLRRLDIQGTSVSQLGVQLVLASSPNITIVF